MMSMRNQRISSFLRTLIANVLLIGVQSSVNAQTLTPPANITVSLAPSTLITAPPDWAWVRGQCAEGKVLKTLQPLVEKKQLAGIVVPIFYGGRAFYATGVAPFRVLDPNVIKDRLADESALKGLLSSAKTRGIPVYLSLNLLAWQTEKLDDPKAGIFGQKEYAAWREQRAEGVLAQQPEAVFASPFHAPVHEALAKLVAEIGRKFPTAGIVLDARLSEREILGFSENARAASILDNGLDPIDLNLQNRADDANTALVTDWIRWRKTQIAALLKTVRENYLAENEGGKVLAWGAASYGARAEFNDLRRAQDWRQWRRLGLIDGVLLCGHPNAPEDAASYSLALNAKEKNFALPVLGDDNTSEKPEAEKSGLEKPKPQNLDSQNDLARDWSLLQTRAPQLDALVTIVARDADVARVFALASGQIKLTRFPLPRAGERLAEITLPQSEGKLWSSRAALGVREILLVIAPNALLKSSGVQIGQVLGAEREVVWAAPGAGAARGNGKGFAPAGAISINDKRRELAAWFSSGVGVVEIDRAGWVRSVRPVLRAANLNKVLGAPEYSSRAAVQRVVETGKPAPDFSIADMNGKSVHLRDFRGRRNLLLTFFPRCFTGGCKQHLASLQNEFENLKKTETEVLAVSVDPPDVQRAFAAAGNLPFALIPDEGRQLCLLFGAATAPDQLASRMSVLIDKRGVVRWIEKNVNVSTHGADALEQVRRLQ